MAGKVILVIVGVIVALALFVAALIFGTWVYVWNINDIIAHGANFWNVFWILLTTLVFFGSASKATS